jgi:hypothetical protein
MQHFHAVMGGLTAAARSEKVDRRLIEDVADIEYL